MEKDVLQSKVIILNQREIGKMEIYQEMFNNFMLMDQFIMVSLRMVKRMDMVFTIFQMEICMMDNGFKIKFKVQGYLDGLMEHNIKDSGKII